MSVAPIRWNLNTDTCSRPSPYFSNQLADAFNVKILHEHPQELGRIGGMFFNAVNHLIRKGHVPVGWDMSEG